MNREQLPFYSQFNRLRQRLIDDEEANVGTYVFPELHDQIDCEPLLEELGATMVRGVAKSAALKLVSARIEYVLDSNPPSKAKEAAVAREARQIGHLSKLQKTIDFGAADEQERLNIASEYGVEVINSYVSNALVSGALKIRQFS